MWKMKTLWKFVEASRYKKYKCWNFLSPYIINNTDCLLMQLLTITLSMCVFKLQVVRLLKISMFILIYKKDMMSKTNRHLLLRKYKSISSSIWIIFYWIRRRCYYTIMCVKVCEKEGVGERVVLVVAGIGCK